MTTNYGAHFLTDGYCDPCKLTASSIVSILEAPGLFMYTIGITDDDLENVAKAESKVEKWLQQEYEPWR